MAARLPETHFRAEPASAASAAAYGSDDRQTLALLLMPMFLLAFAMGLSRTIALPPGDLIARPAFLEPARERLVRLPRSRTPAVAVAPEPAQPVAASPGSQLALLAPEEIAASASIAPAAAPVPVDSAQVPSPSGLDVVTAVPGPQTAATPVTSPTRPTLPAGDALAMNIFTAPEATPVAPRPVTAFTSDEPIDDFYQCSLPAPRPPVSPVSIDNLSVAADADSFGLRLAVAARRQLDDFVVYNDAYRQMRYPMGDVHPMYGVCTDVIIRAYRAVGLDLQELVHVSRVGSGDTNIEHRRVDTLRKFFAAYGEELPATTFAEDYRPGDIVTYYRPQNRHSRTHIAIVSDVVAPSGRPMIIHNRGWGTQQEDGLFVDQITGHYRFFGLKKPMAALRQANAAKSVKRGEATEVVKADVPILPAASHQMPPAKASDLR